MPIRALFCLTLILAALMPSVPEPTDIRALGFAAAAGLLLMTWAMRRLMLGVWPASRPGQWLIGFLVAVMLSALIASLYGTPFDLWFRGAVPFLFLALFFPALHLARTNPGWVLDTVCLSAIVWLVNTLINAATAIPAVIGGEVQRITHATEAWASFQLPYAMVGLALTLLHPPRWLRWARWLVAGAFSLVPVFAVSRGQMLVVLAIWCFYVIRLLRARRGRALFLPVLTFVGLTFAVAQLGLVSNIAERLGTTGRETEQSRFEEVRYAFGQFLESPFFGKGLGYQIPAEITFAGDLAMMAIAGVESVGYMHNVIGYILMDLGLVGLITYAGFILSALRRREPDGAANVGQIRMAASMTVFALLAWFMVQAAFRLVQSNILLASAAAVLAALQGQGTSHVAGQNGSRPYTGRRRAKSVAGRLR